MTPRQNNSTHSSKVRDPFHPDEIVVDRTAAGGYVLREVRPSGTSRKVGTFRRSVDAWRALDAIDTAGI
jgi:hypothetical protein